MVWLASRPVLIIRRYPEFAMPSFEASWLATKIRWPTSPSSPGENLINRFDVFVRDNQNMGWGDRVNIPECSRFPVLIYNLAREFTRDDSAESAFIHNSNPALVGTSRDPTFAHIDLLSQAPPIRVQLLR